LSLEFGEARYALAKLKTCRYEHKAGSGICVVFCTNMEAETIQAPTVIAKQTIWSEAVFLTQVARPGLWTTTALFYLMPLAHGAFARS